MDERNIFFLSSTSQPTVLVLTAPLLRFPCADWHSLKNSSVHVFFLNLVHLIHFYFNFIWKVCPNFILKQIVEWCLFCEKVKEYVFSSEKCVICESGEIWWENLANICMALRSSLESKGKTISSDQFRKRIHTRYLSMGGLVDPFFLFTLTLSSLQFRGQGFLKVWLWKLFTQVVLEIFVPKSLINVKHNLHNTFRELSLYAQIYLCVAMSNRGHNWSKIQFHNWSKIQFHKTENPPTNQKCTSKTNLQIHYNVPSNQPPN